MAALTAFFVYGWCWMPWTEQFLVFFVLVVVFSRYTSWWRGPLILFQFPRWILRSGWSLDTSSRFWPNRPSSCSSIICPFKHPPGFMGPFGDYILSKFLLRDEVNFTVAIGLQTFIKWPSKKIAFFAAGAILIAVPNLYLILLLLLSSETTTGGDKDKNRISSSTFIFKLSVWWMLFYPFIETKSIKDFFAFLMLL